MMLRGPSGGGEADAVPIALNPVSASDRFSSRIVPLASDESSQKSDPAASAAPPARSAARVPPANPPPPAAASRERARAEGPPRGWAIQLASFSNPRNALALRDRLKGLGYSSFVETARQQGKKVTRVIVGAGAGSLAGTGHPHGAWSGATELSGIIVGYPND